MNFKLSLLTSCVALSLCYCTPEKSKNLVVNNTTNNDRSELVSITKADVDAFFCGDKQLVITDACGKQVPYQITHDELVIFPACVKANSSSTYKLTSGKCEEFAPQVFGKHYPERVDDIAWENNRVAFRTYGPQLQRKNERAFGYDVWNKRTEELVAHAKNIEDRDERIRLFELIANQMKRNFHNTYKDASEEDNKIIQDLIRYAGEQFRDDIAQINLLDAKTLEMNTQYDPASIVVSKKKKKKKK